MEEEAYEDFVLAPKANQPSVPVTLVLDRIFAKIVDMDIHGAAAHFVPGSMMVGLWDRQVDWFERYSQVFDEWSDLELESLLPFVQDITFKGGVPIVQPDQSVDYGKFGAVAGIRFFLHGAPMFIDSGKLFRQRENGKAVWRVTFSFGRHVVGSAADNFAQRALLKAAEETASRCSGTMDVALETLKMMWWPR